MWKSHHRGLARTPEQQRPKGRPLVVSFSIGIWLLQVDLKSRVNISAITDCPQSCDCCFTIYRGFKGNMPDIHFMINVSIEL